MRAFLGRSLLACAVLFLVCLIATAMVAALLMAVSWVEQMQRLIEWL